MNTKTNTTTEERKPYRLFLDDERMPPIDGGDFWLIARSYDMFVKTIEEYGNPTFISFDHDLGTEKSGYDAALWLVHNGIVIEKYTVHSENPIGAENIRTLMDNWIEWNKELQ